MCVFFWCFLFYSILLFLSHFSIPICSFEMYMLARSVPLPQNIHTLPHAFAQSLSQSSLTLNWNRKYIIHILNVFKIQFNYLFKIYTMSRHMWARVIVCVCVCVRAIFTIIKCHIHMIHNCEYNTHANSRYTHTLFTS